MHFGGKKKPKPNQIKTHPSPHKQQQQKQLIPLTPQKKKQKQTSKHLLLPCFMNFWLASYQDSFSGTKTLIIWVSAVSLYKKHHLYAQFWFFMSQKSRSPCCCSKSALLLHIRISQVLSLGERLTIIYLVSLVALKYKIILFLAWSILEGLHRKLSASAKTFFFFY